MKLRIFILLFIFGLFLFLLPSLVEAACPVGCTDQCYEFQENPSGCYWFYGGTVERLGILGSLGCCGLSMYHYLDSCSETANPQNKCKEDAFPTGSNGQNCTAIDRRWSFPANCTDCTRSGKWDASDPDASDGPACIQCSGEIENRILGNTTSVGDVCNDNFPAGDGQCESACGADDECDEESSFAYVPGCIACSGLDSGTHCRGFCSSGCQYSKVCQTACGAEAACGGSTPGTSCAGGTCNDSCECIVPGCTISGIPYDDGECNGKCQYCDISQSTTSWSNVPSGQVCYNDSLVDVFDLSGRYCNYREDCSNGDCLAYEWWTSCNGSGSCRPGYDQADAHIEEVIASNGYVLRSNCSETSASPSYYCETPEGECITVSTCNGSMLYKGCYNGSCSSSSTYGYNDTSDDSECDDVVCSTANYCRNSCAWYTGRRCSDGSCDQGYGGGSCNPYTCSAGSCTAICSESCGATCDSDADCPAGSTCQPDCTCSGVPPPFDFSISVDPDSGSAIQGDSTSPSTVTATLTSGTSQAVSFYVGSGLPSGASDSFNPSGCNPTCSSFMTISTSATTPVGTYQLTVCGTTGTITRCYSYYELTVIEAGPGISPPQIRTVPIGEQGAVTINSATIWGELTNMGGAASCLVWFEYKESTDAVWAKVCETTRVSTESFSCDLTELTSSTTYNFEAFAKNGGSW